MSTMLFCDLIIPKYPSGVIYPKYLNDIHLSMIWSSQISQISLNHPSLHPFLLEHLEPMFSPWIWPLSAGSPWRTLHPRAVVQRCCAMWSKGMCCWKCHWKLGITGNGSSLWFQRFLGVKLPMKLPYWGKNHPALQAILGYLGYEGFD